MRRDASCAKGVGVAFVIHQGVNPEGRDAPCSVRKTEQSGFSVAFLTGTVRRSLGRLTVSGRSSVRGRVALSVLETCAPSTNPVKATQLVSVSRVRLRTSRSSSKVEGGN